MQASFAHDITDPYGLELQNLEELVMWDPANWVDLALRRSEQPQLRISGHKAMLQRYQCSRRGNTLYIKLGGNLFDRIADAFTTSLTRKHIHIDLIVESLVRVRATGMVEVDLVDWSGAEPEINLFGPTTLWGGKFPVLKP